MLHGSTSRSVAGQQTAQAGAIAIQHVSATVTTGLTWFSSIPVLHPLAGFRSRGRFALAPVVAQVCQVWPWLCSSRLGAASGMQYDFGPTVVVGVEMLVAGFGFAERAWPASIHLTRG